MKVKRPVAGGVLVGLLTVGAAAPALAGTITNVGGGTWSYGTAFQAPWFKNVWSHYVHPAAYHSATAIGGPNTVKVYATANSWAKANTQCGVGENAAQYWNTY
ncbi:lactococcin 972 family bacteriocin [Arthrobacter bambusae]|uniref:lactococcin 972 family bacteriocin n=1 Tax=Arthrobacter bambusae TaxID=1338426 RepID=UPI0027871733|nr:lactococcin 972 family bacteriocin [Arthrobacter bambusae]MDQ0028237.1 lactococcin 972 family bacteriocin [Arthrobacter bambusae]MDQ0096969.1 lactococcin 972 family bacteriocin [Arthrobacter bambusae]